MSSPYITDYSSCTYTLFCNVPFDNNYTDHFYNGGFKYNGGNIPNLSYDDFLDLRKSDNTNYFPSLLLNNDGNGYNFNYNNALTTSIIIEIPSNNKNFINANYIKVTSTLGSKLYYFITGCSQLNGNTYEFQCELDVVATYELNLKNSLKDIPLNTKRKHSHRYNYETQSLFCPDVALNDSATNGYKPKTIKKDEINMKIKYIDGVNYADFLNNIKWVYIAYTDTDLDGIEINNNVYPINIICIPLVPLFKIKYKYVDGSWTEKNITPSEYLKSIYDDTRVIASKISPYPPFSTLFSERTGWDKAITFTTVTSPYGVVSHLLLEIVFTDTTSQNNGRFYIGDSRFRITKLSHSNNLFSFLLINGGECVYDYYAYNNITPTHINIPTINTLRDGSYEPKLRCSPLTSYYIKSQFSEEKQVYIECSYYSLTGDYLYPEIKTISTPLPDDMSISTFINDIKSNTNTKYILDEYYPYNNSIAKGVNDLISSNANYSYPLGSDAYKQWEETQASSFTGGKTAQIIGGGLVVLASLASTIASYGALSVPATMGIASGVSMMTTGVQSLINKEIDLKNTPDTIQSLGSNYLHDSLINSKLLPYLVTYSMNKVEEDLFLDYFYDYGYEVNRCCYWNEEILFKYVNGNTISLDNNLFGRTLFNYIQLSEDITNKLNDISMSIPIKKKISSILTKGIKMWTFFGLSKNNLKGKLYDYLFNNKYENAEYYTNVTVEYETLTITSVFYDVEVGENDIDDGVVIPCNSGYDYVRVVMTDSDIPPIEILDVKYLKTQPNVNLDVRYFSNSEQSEVEYTATFDVIKYKFN